MIDRVLDIAVISEPRLDGLLQNVLQRVRLDLFELPLQRCPLIRTGIEPKSHGRPHKMIHGLRTSRREIRN